MKNPNSRNGKAIIFTRQDTRSLDVIRNKGRFTNKRSYIEEGFGDISNFFLSPYNWFVEEASKKVEKPDDVEYPIWCAVDWRNCLKPMGDTLVYVLEVPEEKIIYFDGSKWDFVLNEHYVPDDNEDLESYNRDLKRKGIDSGYEFLRGNYAHMYPLETQKVLESRKKIFNIDSWNIFAVQANIWELREEWIKRIVRPEEDFTEEDMKKLVDSL